MTENDKAELIKKTENKQEPQQNKKIVVVKKVKKVIIKKQIHQKQDEESQPIDDKDRELNNAKDNVVEVKNETPNENVTPKKETLKIVLSKDKEHRDNRNKNFQNTQGNNRPFFNRHPGTGGQRTTFKDNKNHPGGSKPFNKTGFGAKTPTSTTPILTDDKDRSRKKLNKKNYNNKTYFNEEEEIQKAFNKRRKEKSQIDSIPETVDIIDVISISDLAKKMNIKANVIIQKLMELGSMVTINDKIDADTASIVASEYGCKVNVVSLYDQTVIEEDSVKEIDLIPRPPIVTVMGHVDHGKTKLLDAIRSTDVVGGESGGITQHIGAYSVRLANGHLITFIDTPGHESFTMMRARGAQVTDIVILVVAADDGVMPQTLEAIKHAKEAGVAIIVAVNKVDKPSANVDRVKQQLSEHELLPEEWGGQTLYCEVSALKRVGIKELLDAVMLQSEMLNLTVSYKMKAVGFILESKIDQGRGVVATVLVLKGTLKVGDFFVAGVYFGKVRAMHNDRGEKIKEATPSIPVEITGLEEVPRAGDPFNVTATEKEAKNIASKRQELNRMEDAKSVKKLTLKDMLSQKVDGEQQEIKIIVKADVQGSAEAIKESLEKLSNREIKLTIVSSSVGAINEGDVMLAIASKALIIGFHVRPNPKATSLAEKEKVEIKRYNIIFDVIEDIKSSMEGMIKPDLLEELIGTIEVKQVFKISKIGTVAGCLVTKGKVKRNSMLRVIRDDVVIYSGKMQTLKRFKDEASEVFEGTECGISIENYKDIKEGDIFEAYEIKEISRTLEDVELREIEIANEAKNKQEDEERNSNDTKEKTDSKKI